MEYNDYKNSNNAQNSNNKENNKELNNNISDSQKKEKMTNIEKEVDNETIIELEIKKIDNSEINILCDKNRLIEDNIRNKNDYKKNNKKKF